MTRPELIEVLARAIANEIHECGDFGITGNDAYEARTEDFKAQAKAVLAAIEARGLAIVPVEATEAEIDAIKAADSFKMNHGLQIEDVLELRTSMIAAGRI